VGGGSSTPPAAATSSESALQKPACAVPSPILSNRALASITLSGVPPGGVDRFHKLAVRLIARLRRDEREADGGEDVGVVDAFADRQLDLGGAARPPPPA
jgi:hypothetical protein